MEIIQEAQRKSRTEYTREFKYSKDHNSGYSFPCDSKGNIISLRPASQENYDKIKLGQEDVIDEGVELCNGMGFSPDLLEFYSTDTIKKTVYLPR